METKQVILIRSDLRMRKGKEAAQISHASQMWLVQRSLRQTVASYPQIAGGEFSLEEWYWLTTGTTKIVLKCTSEAELLEIDRAARVKGLNTSLVRDSGHTEVPPGTITALAIGPHEVSKFDGLTNNLQLY